MFATSQNFPHWGSEHCYGILIPKNHGISKLVVWRNPSSNDIPRIIRAEKKQVSSWWALPAFVWCFWKKTTSGKSSNKFGQQIRVIGVKNWNSGSSKQGDTIPSSILMVFTQERWGLSWANGKLLVFREGKSITKHFPWKFIAAVRKADATNMFRYLKWRVSWTCKSRLFRG